MDCYCETCGCKIDIDDLYCHSCGAPIHKRESDDEISCENNEETAKENKEKRFFMIGCAIVGALVMRRLGGDFLDYFLLGIAISLISGYIFKKR